MFYYAKDIHDALNFKFKDDGLHFEVVNPSLQDQRPEFKALHFHCYNYTDERIFILDFAEGLHFGYRFLVSDNFRILAKEAESFANYILSRLMRTS